MPFYRINGMPVHVKFSGKKKSPAPCVAQVLLRKVSLRRCGAISAFLCDWPLSDGKTCDAPLCAAHAKEVGRNRHYCPIHHAKYLELQPQLALFGQVGSDKQ